MHTGLGHPGQGQTSSELRHEGAHTSTKQGGGLAGRGASGVASSNQMVDKDTQPKERALEKEEGQFAGTRGNKGDEYPQPPAQDRVPESADSL